MFKYKAVVVVWANEQTSFLRSVPLHINANRMQARAFAGRVDVVFAFGLDTISHDVRRHLDKCGVVIHDASQLQIQIDHEFAELKSKFVSRDINRYYFFTRWILIDRLFNRTPVLAFDGDIIFNVDPEELGVECQGHTFNVKSTCFQAISDIHWFATYESHLRQLMEGASTYLREIAGRPISEDEYMYGAMSPEEYFVADLVRIGAVRQDFSFEKSRYLWFAHPLFPSATLCNPSEKSAGWRYARDEDHLDRINGMPVAFWHVQQLFSNYAGLALLLKQLNLESVGNPLPLAFPPFTGGAHKKEKLTVLLGALWDIVCRHNPGNMSETVTREAVCRHFFEHADFSELYHPKKWHEPRLWDRPTSAWIPSMYKLGTKLLFTKWGPAKSFVLSGWSQPEESFTWTNGQSAEVSLKVNPTLAGHYELEVVAGAFVGDWNPVLHADIEVNGTPAGTMHFKAGEDSHYPGRKFSFPLPNGVIHKDGETRITFKIVGAKRPVDAGISRDARQLGLSVSELTLKQRGL